MDLQEMIKGFIKPELMILVPALFLMGKLIYDSLKSKGREGKIPIILGITSLLSCALWVFGTSTISIWQDVLLAIFTVIVQGFLTAGGAVYLYELSNKKPKES